jgi:integrase
VRRKLAAGIDPADERRTNGTTPTDGAPSNTFEAIAREWFAKHSPAWAPGHGDKIIRRLETNIFPWLKQNSIQDIKPLELLTVIQRIEQRGRNETAHRALQNCGRVFRYAVATGRAERDITRDLITRCALRLAPLVFVRPGELRMAEWTEFNLDESEWRIPAARMKMRSHHYVPLAIQAVEILR